MPKTKKNNSSQSLPEGFIPLQPLDLSKCRDFDELVAAMSKTAFGGRRVGEAAEVLEKMFSDKNSFNVLTLSGAMTVAKMGLIFCDLIDRGYIKAVVSTGALISHGMVEGLGMNHFKLTGEYNDRELCSKGYDRVYDTIELDKNLDDMYEIVKDIFKDFDVTKQLSSSFICHKIGEYLAENVPGRAVLKSAYQKGVPVYIPAFTDSELGMDLVEYNQQRKLEGKEPFIYNPMIDLEHFADLIFKQKTTGILTIGGGVPRNWAQQIGVYWRLIKYRVYANAKVKPKNFDEYEHKKYKYACRICPENVEWGGLSGCTYSEGVSWGKFVAPKDGGCFAEVLSDATAVLPLLIKAVFQRIDKRK